MKITKQAQLAADTIWDDYDVIREAFNPGWKSRTAALIDQQTNLPEILDCLAKFVNHANASGACDITRPTALHALVLEAEKLLQS